MTDMVQRLGPAVARLRNAAGDVVGVGFLIAPDTVCTCAHVVAQALGVSGAETEAKPPSGRVLLDFPLLADGVRPIPRYETHVAAWQMVGNDDSGDIALLRLPEELPGPGQSVPLVSADDVWDHRFRVLGFPRGGDQGVWATGRLRAAVGAGWVAMDEDGSRPRIGRGYSGSPVWDAELGGVIGMTVAVERGSPTSTAYLIPSAALLDMQPGLRRCPYRGLEPFREEDEEFFYGREEETGRVADAVLQHPVVAVVGPSGSGKSSLVRAGVIPALRHKGFTVITFRPVQGARPISALAHALLSSLDTTAEHSPRLEQLAARLSEGGGDADCEVAALLGEELLERGGPAGNVLFLDQLEEVASADPAEARRLLSLVIAMGGAARLTDPRRHRIVATLRPGSLDGLLEPATDRLLGEGVQFLAPPGREALLRAVTAPTARVPGLAFEPGLPERIVDDAGSEPGYLPLVEFVLTRLWEEHQASLLTHDVYDALGGVGGALSAYAEDIVRPVIAELGEVAPQRLFAQLARPDGAGRFARRPADLDALDPDVQSVARSLARTRLVVLNRGPVDEQLVDLAHEALISQWPRLRGWLEESREFRTWQEQIRGSAAVWQANCRDVGSLLRGVLLERALEWLAKRPADISADERRYIELSRHHRQRGVRRWRAVTGVIAALALVAGLLTVYALTNNARLQDELRIQASATLGEESEARADSEPGTAIQLALAAWRNGHTPEAYQALLRQYLAARDAVRVHPALLSGPVSRLDATPDGKTVVTREGNPSERTERITVRTGLLGHAPRSWRVPNAPDDAVAVALSDDGRYLAASCADGRVMVWDVKAKKPGRVMPQSTARAGSELNTVAFDFSADGRRLLHLSGTQDKDAVDGTYRGRDTQAHVWDVARAQAVFVDRSAVPDWDYVSRAALSDDGKSLVVQSGLGDTGIAVGVSRLDSGDIVQSFPRTLGITSRGGTVVVPEKGGRWARVTPIPGGTGNGARIRINSEDFPPDVDVSGHYLMEHGSAGTMNLIDIRDGKRYHLSTPPVGTVLPVGTVSLLVVRQSADVVKATSFIGLDRWVLQARRVEDTALDPTPNGSISGEQVVQSPDGHYRAGVGGDTPLMVTVRGEEKIHQIQPKGFPEYTPVRVTFTANSRYLVVWHGSRLLTYSLPDLRLTAQWSSGQTPIVDVVALDGDQTMVLTEQSLLRFDAASGTAHTESQGICADGGDRTEAAKCLDAAPRPGHKGQIAILTANNRVQLWDTRTRKVEEHWSVGSVSAVSNDYEEYGMPFYLMVFDSGGERLAVVTDDGVKIWKVDRPRAGDVRIRSTFDEEIIGFGPDDTLLFSAAGNGPEESADLDIFSIKTGHLLASVSVPEKVGTAWQQPGKELAWLTATGRLSISLNPDTWFRTLCTAAGRDFTKAEKQLLPAGADASPPCGE
ncbi:trypsin-like peptidase domain-containing protein [Streptomyces cupreus]|uniref:Trypsin-like peptidase domain-containing protein n=1 Tax=Streptomyces cupreus TaxID=2759956 RepID=A0A7X1MAU8_9ACTN|nr:trypsin-like peptidase domain-containing protein [Streptomyces cupreus]MBC2904719.1 trypsin-like peptidase domain-containing protein [Streptomyces cupreus]